MAAILCKGCQDICSAPCKLCGHCCNGCCNSCDEVCRNLGQLCCSPFCPFVAVAFIFNVPTALMGLQSLAQDDVFSCQGVKWLFINSLLCIANVAAAIYMSLKLQQHRQEQLNNPTTTVSTFEKARTMLCYDPWIAAYLVSLIVFIVWLSTAGGWLISGKVSEGCSNEDFNVNTEVGSAMASAWAFLSFGFVSFCLSMCLVYCRKDSGATAYHYNNGSSAPTATTAYVNAADVEKQDNGKMSAVATPVQPSAPTKDSKQNVPVAQAVAY